MKQTFLIALTFLAVHCIAQKKLPIIKANAATARIYEEDRPEKAWHIDPKIKLDVFTTSKLVKAKTIKFKTDADSIVFKLKPGEKKDFIILLNGKDSCFTRIASPEMKNFSKTKPEIHDSIPLTINSYNTVYVKTVLNKTDSLHLNFDTGTTELDITQEALQHKIKAALQYYDTYYAIKIGHRAYKSRVFPTELTGHDTDGRFGWDLFDGLIVELNYDQNLMIIHSVMPKYVTSDKKFTKLPIKYFSTVFMVEGTIAESGAAAKAWFLFDTGYQRTAMLDNDLLQSSRFPVEKMEVIKKAMIHGASGNEVPVITSNLQTLRIGKYDLKNVPVQVLTGNKPLKGAPIHILGNEVLKRFNTVLDFQHNVIYLKPNHLYHDAYDEQKKA